MDIDVAGRPMAAYQSGDGDIAVIVAHELFGVTADIRGVVDRLGRLGYYAIAPEFHHRVQRHTDLPRDAAGREAGFELLHRLTREQALADVAAVIHHVAPRPVAMIGFSFGGHLAYLAATRLDLAATAVLYGGWLTGTDIPLSRPEPTITLTPGIRGRLLYVVGDRDHVITAPERARLRAALEPRHEYVELAGIEHAFFWDEGSARDEAWRRIEALLGQVAAVSSA
jgi:carboxymethylenebutenolidase